MSSDSRYAVTFSARDAGEQVIVFRLPGPVEKAGVGRGFEAPRHPPF